MQSIIKNCAVHYIQYGKGTKDVVLLHGWGQNIEMMQPLGNCLQENYRITILDFPGFGKSQEPNEAWEIEDYCNLLKELLNELQVKKPIIMGHSFGGRVAIAYAAKNEIEKLVLFASPCVRENTKPSLKVRALKSLKKVPGLKNLSEVAKKYIGSRDYKAATPIMRSTMVNVVNQDLSNEAKKISVPTLLIWGEDDDEAPVEDAKKLEQIMKDAGLIILPGTHYAYLENLSQVNAILKNFL